MILGNGKISHVASETTDDPTGAGENHGDRVIADALANWVLYEHQEGRRGGSVQPEYSGWLPAATLR